LQQRTTVNHDVHEAHEDHKDQFILRDLRGLLDLRDSYVVVTAGDWCVKQPLLEILKTRPLLGDGAMGTQLMLAGLEQGNCGEEWNLTHPDRVLAIQRRYAEAGSECILTNTFGGSRIMLNRHSNADKVVEINQAGVAIARTAFGNRHGYVIGDIGPFGGLMEPYGEFTEDQVREAFTEQAQALVDAGADAIIIETQTSLEELVIGITAAKEAGSACVIGSMAYDVTLDG
jgi:5-methyltetrahydrofolate--homocysteine methyltransferase